MQADPNIYVNKKNIINFFFEKNKTDNDCDITPILFLLNASPRFIYPTRNGIIIIIIHVK
jgi:hypothetical protein